MKTAYSHRSRCHVTVGYLRKKLQSYFCVNPKFGITLLACRLEGPLPLLVLT